MQYLATDVTVETEHFFQASDALEMQRVLDEFLTSPLPDHDSGVTSAELAGAGSGHPFIVRLGINENEPGGSLAAVRMTVYSAADELELPIARAAAIARAIANGDISPFSSIHDELFAGGKQGTPFMGIIVTGITIPS